MRTKLLRKNKERKTPSAEQPVLEPGHRPEAKEAAPDIALPGLREGFDLLGNAAGFEELVEKSLAFALDVMNMTIPDDAPIVEKIKLMTLKKEVTASVLSAAVRTSNEALKKKDTDKVAELLSKVKRGSPAVGTDEVTKDELFS